MAEFKSRMFNTQLQKQPLSLPLGNMNLVLRKRFRGLVRWISRNIPTRLCIFIDESTTSISWMYFFVFQQPFRIIYRSSRPVHLLLMCLKPFPFHYRLPPPLSPASILSNPSIVFQRMDDIGLPDSRYMWPFYVRDTPLRCLYRIYEWAMIGREIQLGYETQYFWCHPSWKVQDIPDPKDPDPVRYAILASFVETMAICFNERVDLGLLRNKDEHECSRLASHLRETLSREEFKAVTEAHHEHAPSWVFTVQGPAERFVIHPGRGGGIFHDRNVEIGGGGYMSWI